jgi:hypothetical protein
MQAKLSTFFKSLTFKISFCLFLSVLGVENPLFGQITSQATGNWNNTATWVGGIVPTGTDNVIIAGTHTVTLTAPAACNNLTIDAGGILELGIGNLTVGGTTDVSGSLIDTNSGGTYIFDGKVTVLNNGSFTKPLGSSNAFIFNNDIEVRDNAELSLDGDGTMTFSGVTTQTFTNTSAVNPSMTFRTSANTNINVNQSLILAGTQGIIMGAGNNGFVIIAADKIITNNNTSKITIKSDLNGTNINSEWINGVNSTVGFTLNKQPIMSTGKLTATAVPNTVEYISTQTPCAGCEQVRAGTYHHIITNNFTRQLAGTTTLTGNFSVNGGTFNTNNQDLTIGGNFSSVGGSTVNLGASNVSIGGNFVRGGTLNANTSTVIFNGSTPQTVFGSASFFNLNINQTPISTTVTLNNPTTVTNGLILTNGIVVLTNGNDLTVTSSGTSAISGFSGSSYVRTKTGANTANLVRTNLGVTPATYYFPVGTDTEGYNLFAFSYGAMPPAGNHSVKVITAGTFPPISLTPSANTKVVWEVLKPVGANANLYMDWQIPANANGTFSNGDLLVQDAFPYGNWTASGQTYNNPPSTGTIFTTGAPFFGGSASPVRFAVVSNAPPPPTQPAGNRGIWFDGVDDRVVVPTNPTTVIDNFTIETWVKLQRTPSTGTVAVVVYNGGNTSTNGYGILISDNRNFQVFRGGVGSVLQTNHFLTLNQWTHLTFVREAGVYKTYVNGNPVTITNLDGTNPNVPSGGLLIGTNNIGTEAFPGQIDEVRVFDIVRNAPEIQTDMATTTPNGAVGYWNFDDDVTAGNQTIAVNTGSAGAAANGTLTNNPLWALRVTDNTDNGMVGLGSLRQAITEANLDTDTDYIDFSIGNTTPTIRVIAPTSSLIATQPIVIDGYSALGTSPNTANLSSPNNAILRIELNFSGIPVNSHGLVIDNANNCSLKGLAIYGVPDAAGFRRGINIQGTSTANRIEGCYVGLRADGTVAANKNMNGIGLDGNGGNIVGWNGTLKTGTFNIIANNLYNNIQVASSNNIIQGNFIGTDKSGNTGLGNFEDGISITDGVNTQVLNNVISGNVIGIRLRLNSSSTIIKGNLIGLGADGTTSVPNSLGIYIANSAINSVIGGIMIGEGNSIANNLAGIQIDGNTATGHRISGNKIYGNTGGFGGISLISGGNANKIAPMVTAATSILISGTCQSGDVVEVFQDNPQFGATDQGRTFLGQAIVVGTNWTLAGVFSNGDRITATATSNGVPFNTSPFATAFVVSAGIPSAPVGNRGMWFDGINDFVSGTLSTAPANDNITLEAWVKRTPDLLFGEIVRVGTNNGYSLYLDNGNFLISVQNIGYVTTNYNVEADKWTHLAAVRSGGSWTLYANGVVVPITSGATLTPIPPTSVLFVGERTNVIYPFYKGQVDEVGLFNVARTQAEIQMDMGSPLPNGALVYWNFDESTGITVNDISGNGNNGTMAAAPAAPLWALRVTDNTDNGMVGLGSLRQAITEANLDADIDYIDFSIDNIAPTTRTISPTSSLIINQRVVLDGYTALGAIPNSANLTAPNNAVLRIELDFSGLPPSSHGIVLDGASNGSFIRGLSIYGVPTLGGSLRGINVQGTSGGNRIEGCYVGLRADGTPAANKNMNGIGLDGVGGNIVGWNINLRTEAFNLISNSNFNGVPIGSNNNIIQGNFIGLQRDGTAAGNSERGFLVNQAGNQILNNVISGNGTVGVDIRDNAFNTQVRGNKIGTDLAGTAGIPNGSFGVRAFNNSNNNIIGGVNTGEGNTIAFNGDFGVNITNNSNGNTIVRNNIFENNNGGIALCAGCNGNKPVPLISNANATTISGTCQTGDIVEIFNDTPDFSSTNQGRVYLGTATTVGTNWTFTGVFSNGDRITATATSGVMPFNTSPFSLASIVAQAPPLALAATNVTNTSFTANWTNIGATAYELELSNTNSFTGTPTHTGISTNFINLTGAANQTYFYRVRASAPSLSAWSNIKMTSTILLAGSGSALTFGGTNEVNVGTSPEYNFNGTPTFTLEAWIKTNNNTTVQTIIHRGKTAPSFRNYWFGLNATNQLVLSVIANSTQQDVTGASGIITNGNWHHVAVSVTNTGIVTFYINGIAYAGSTTITGTLNDDLPSSLQIGYEAGLATGNPFDGQIDEVRIYNIEKDITAIRADMCKKLVGNEAGLIANFRFDENTGITVENRARLATVDGIRSGAAFGVSGAALGDVSAHQYDGGTNVSLLGEFIASVGLGLAIGEGIQVYKVNNIPNSITVNPLVINTLETSRYYGTFLIGLSNVDVSYDYTTNTNINGQVNEPKARLYARNDNTGAFWNPLASTINTTSNILARTNVGRREFITGFRNFVSVNQPGAGKALRFNGIDQYVDLGLGLGLVGSSFTMEAWVKIPTNTFTHQNTILGKNINAGTISYRFNIDNAGRLGLWVGDGMVSDAFLAPTPITPNQWTHVAAVYDNVGATLTLYINGIQANQIPSTISGLVGSFLPTLIGSLNLNAANYFEGEIDEVRVWNTARTQAQLRDDMCQKIANPSMIPTLSAYYRLDEGIGAATEDRATLFGDGTLVNSPTWVTSGAALGDISAAQYDAGINVGVPDVDLFTASFIMTPLVAGQGVHVYKVREAPNNVSIPIGFTALETSRYFGIFKVNAPDVDISYKYDANPNIAGTPQEFLSAFAERDDNADLTWSSPLLVTGFALTLPNNRFMSPPNPITAIQREFLIGFTSSIPNIQASEIQFTQVTPTNINLTWTNGNGQNRIVVISTTPNFTIPANFTTYNVNDALGMDGKVIFNGNGNIASVTNLTPETKYFFYVYEYNGTGMTTIYNIAPAMNNPNAVTTLAPAPASQPTGLVFSNLTSNGVTASFTPTMPPAKGYLAVLRKPSSRPVPPADGAENDIGTQFFNEQIVVAFGANTTFDVSKLDPATTYVIDIYAFNGTRASIAYNKNAPLSGEFTTLAPRPDLTSLTPNIKTVGDKGFTLQANGRGFIPKTQLSWNGQAIPTTYVSPTVLTTEVEDAKLFEAGIFQVIATNPAPGGGQSNNLPFTVIPAVTIKNIPLISKIVAPDKNDHLLYRLEFLSAGGETTLKQVKFTTGGTYQLTDLKGLAFTLRYSDDENLDDNDRILLTANAVNSGGAMTFDLARLQNAAKLPKNKLGHLLLTVNIAKDAMQGREINIKSIKFEDIEFVEAVTKQGLNPTQEGIVQKISSNTPSPQDYSALVKFFNEMGGKDWVNVWNLNNPVNTWKGVELDENGNVIALSLAGNNLVGKLSDALMIDGVLISKSLKYINLSGNKIVGQIPSNIGNLTNIEYLDLSNNLLNGDVSGEIGKLTNLVTLWLSFNQFNKIDIDFSRLASLRNLFLQNNNLETLPDNLFTIKQLEVLSLQGNKFKTLPNSIGQLQNLKYLDISSNELVQMPQGIAALGNLETFLAHDNFFKTLPNGLLALTKLQQFTIEDNFLEFGSLEPLRQWWAGQRRTNVLYSPQAKIGAVREIVANIGAMVTLEIPTSGTANLYQWVRNGVVITDANDKAYTIKALSIDEAGTYTLIVRNSLVPDLVLQSYNITIFPDCGQLRETTKPMIAANGNVTFCGTERVNTRLSTTEGADIQSYKWFLNGVEINNSDRSAIFARDAGRYRVQIQTKDRCTLISDDLAIFLFPEYSVTITKSQDNLVANASDRQLVSYEWLLGNTPIIGANAQVFVPQQTGNYRVQVTDINGCRSVSLPFEVTMVSVTAVEDNIYNGEIKIYPNPSENMFYVEIGKEKVSKIQIFNAIGKFYNEKIILLNNKKYQINLENQANGLYFVEITTSKGKVVKKIVKE